MKLSIILPVYNMEKYLERCIDSVINQDIKKSEYEVIIINDGSTDNSLKIAVDYSKKHKNIIVHTKKNGGLGAARNTGIKMAKGNYIYFLDTDDYIVDNCLNFIIKAAENYKVDIITFFSTMTTVNHLNKSSTPSLKNLNNVITGIEYLGNNSFRNEVWWYVIDKRFLDKSKLIFDEGQWLEDAKFTASLFLKAKKVLSLPIDIHRYRIRPDSIVRNKDESHYFKVLNDQEKVINDFWEIIKDLPNTSNKEKKCLDRLTARQQSFVFFYIIRFLKSNSPINLLIKKLTKFKTISAYPLNKFIGEEYNGIKYKIIVYVFNHYSILYLFSKTYRLLNNSIKINYREK